MPDPRPGKADSRRTDLRHVSVFISPPTTTSTTNSNNPNDNDHRDDKDRDDDHDRRRQNRDRRSRRDHDWDGDRGRDRGNDDHDHDEHTPGQPMEGRTQIMFARSLDCGATFSRPTQISDRTQINQGSVAAIDPNTGAIYVAWREFLSAAQPDAILVTKSTDGGVDLFQPGHHRAHHAVRSGDLARRGSAPTATRR